MNKGWIYIGADKRDVNWSKIGKTAGQLTTRHTSSQRPSYYIYTAFEIVQGSVHQIEDELKKHLNSFPDIEREDHFSTGNESECFLISPEHMCNIVKNFFDRYYCQSVQFNSLTDDYSAFQSQLAVNTNDAIDHLGMNKHKYFSDNQVKFETDLGNGHFLDNETGKEGYRDEEGNVYWK